MFRGLFTNIALAFAQFPVTSVKGHDIFPLLWEAIGCLNRIGLGLPTQYHFLHLLPQVFLNVDSMEMS